MTKSKKRFLNQKETPTDNQRVEQSQPVIKQTKINQSNDIFTLFSKKVHQVNWYVHRDKNIRDSLKSLWGKGPENKKQLDGYNQQQLIACRANALMRLLEKNGPKAGDPTEFKIKLDSRHGAVDNTKKDCVSKGYYHAHVLDGNLTYVLVWECFEKQKLINIISLSAHENLDYSFKGHNPVYAMDEAMEVARIANFNPNRFDHDTYNNKIYSKN